MLRILKYCVFLILILSISGCSKYTYVEKSNSPEYPEFEYIYPLFNYFLPIYPNIFYECDSLPVPKAIKEKKKKSRK